MTQGGTVGRFNFPVTSAWSDRGDLLFADGVGRLVRVRMGETAAVDVVREGGDASDGRRLVGFLPGSSRYLFVREAGSPDALGLFVSDLDDDRPARLDPNSWSAGALVDAATVLLKRGPSIVEQRLKPGAAGLDGPARTLLNDAAAPARAWTASANGVLVVANAQQTLFRWRDRSGQPGPTMGPKGRWVGFSLTASGDRVATAQDITAGAVRRNLWTIDGRGVAERLTFGPTRDNDPLWSGDGRQVAFTSGGGVNTATSAWVVAPGSEPRPLADDPAGLAVDDWSRDGQWLLYHHRLGMPGAEPGVLFARDLTGSAAPRRVARCTAGTLDEARISDDGRLVAFNCDEAGRHEVYVAPFPEGAPRVRVSVDGGVQAAWRGDGRELYYLSPGGEMMVADVAGQPELRVGTPRLLFDTDLTPSNQTEQYRVTSDGQRFLLLEPESSAPPLRVIVNWRERFKAESP